MIWGINTADFNSLIRRIDMVDSGMAVDMADFGMSDFDIMADCDMAD